jgi:hypothetical protein
MLCDAPGFPHTHNHIPHKVLCYVIYVMYVMCWAYRSSFHSVGASSRERVGVAVFGEKRSTVEFDVYCTLRGHLVVSHVHVVVASSSCDVAMGRGRGQFSWAHAWFDSVPGSTSAALAAASAARRHLVSQGYINAAKSQHAHRRAARHRSPASSTSDAPLQMCDARIGHRYGASTVFSVCDNIKWPRPVLAHGVGRCRRWLLHGERREGRHASGYHRARTAQGESCRMRC